MDLGVLGYYRQMILHPLDADERDVFYIEVHVSTLPSGALSTALRALSACFGLFEAFASQQVSFSLTGFARPRTTKHRSGKLGSTPVARPWEVSLKC